MPRLRVLTALLLLAACGSSSSTVGPLTIEPPEGWLVSGRMPGTIKVANGTAGDGTTTQRASATAVFDIYVDTAQSLREFRKVLKENNVAFDEERTDVDGYNAVMLTSEDSAFAPPQQTVFIPEWDVRIVYRAAHPDQISAFEAHLDEFHDALDSITFRGQPPA